MKNSEYLKDRIRGAIYGVAVGDALGGPLEFMRAETISKKYGRVKDMLGGGWLNMKPGEVTDDTQMTMAVALGIEENPDDPIPSIGRRFIEWFKGGPKDVGGTCAHAIASAMFSEALTSDEWMKVGQEVNRTMNGRTAGNGALMRTVYTGLYYADPERRKAVTMRIGSMTHDNVESNLACANYADAIHAAIFGGHPITSINATNYMRGLPPTGYVIDTWNNVLDSIMTTDTFEDAVVEAVNRGGDADTIGAITGGLAGAYYGYRAIPKRWTDSLAPSLKMDMDRLAETAYNANRDYYLPGSHAPQDLTELLEQLDQEV